MIVGIPPQQEGVIERGSVQIAYQAFGDGPRSLLLLPTWPIVHSDFWRAQVPHLMSRYRLVTFDGRGNGASDRPEDVASYTGAVMVADALAVLDAVGIDRVAVLSVSLGAFWAALLAVNHPDRVAASAFIAPYMPLGPQTPERAAAAGGFDTPLPRYEGWQKWNRHYWHEDWPGFLEFFFSQCFTEPDSRAYIDHFIEMGLMTTPEIITLSEEADDLDEAIAHKPRSEDRLPIIGDPRCRGRNRTRLLGHRARDDRRCRAPCAPRGRARAAAPGGRRDEPVARRLPGACVAGDRVTYANAEGGARCSGQSASSISMTGASASSADSVGGQTTSSTFV